MVMSPSRPSPPGRSGTRASIGRVLVVDDDDALRECLRIVLENAGYRVVCAGDGVSALALMHRETIGVVVLDLRLPQMDGYELRRRQLLEPALAKIPIVVLTGDTHASLGDDVPVLWKPFEIADLLKVVWACCLRGEAAEASTPDVRKKR